ncbi:MAG TPA: rhodanese-like domain-containing protein [Burkholderiales bacterium]|nr:rhodanese-like domain-containing protein [Burkholderiales bacterium]
MGSFLEVDAGGLQEMLRDEHVLIDVRTDGEVARGLIPGARHIPLHAFAASLAQIGRECPVVVYCQSGVRSAQAATFLAQSGWPRVYNLKGGFGAWTALGFPVARP